MLCRRVLRRFLRHFGRLLKMLLSGLEVMRSSDVDRVAKPTANDVNGEAFDQLCLSR